MKKFFAVWGFAAILLMSGCGLSEFRIETLKDWSFQYNEETDDYSIFFGLADKNDSPLSADVSIDIRIVNDENEEVYAETRSVSTDDFGYYSSEIEEDQYLANVKIPADKIQEGKSSSGKVYLTVYKEDVIQFDEVSCDALFCLPVKDIKVTFDAFPLDLKSERFFRRDSICNPNSRCGI